VSKRHIGSWLYIETATIFRNANRVDALDFCFGIQSHFLTPLQVHGRRGSQFEGLPGAPREQCVPPTLPPCLYIPSAPFIIKFELRLWVVAMEMRACLLHQ